MLTVLVVFLEAWPGVSHAQGIDPDLRLGIMRTNQSVVLNWFGSNSVLYQLESSSSLTSWVNSGSVIMGQGGLFVTNITGGSSSSFFRVKRLVPAGVTADFDPGTGILTILGNELDNVITVSRDAAGNLRANGGAITVRGGTPTVANTTLIQIFGSGGNDRLTLDEANGALPKANLFGEAGNDILTGGSGADTLNGGLGADMLFGGEGNDLINGGDGDDTVLMGGGDDTFVWNPGDDNDTLEGQAGMDTLLFNGSNIAEKINITANGGRIRFFRDVASVTMDLNDTEIINFNAQGGADAIVVNDLSGTDVTTINLNLALVTGSGDAQPDTVGVVGTSGDDVVVVSGDSSGSSVLGLPARVNITGAEGATDRLTITALAGDDVVEASGLAAGAIRLTADGGPGDDILSGGAGNDTLLGGDDNDVLLGGPGIDVLDGGLGDNTVIQD